MYQGDYTLVGSEMSFFTRKLEAQLRFQQIPWHWQFKTQERTAELEARAGTHFIPLLMTPEKWLVHDTIALGPRPCLADFALAGASKAHYITDPTPVSWLGEYREMLFDYTERFFQDGMDASDWLPDDQVPESLTVVLDYLQGSYFQFATANIAAGLAGEKYYEYDYGFGPTRARTQKRLNMARLHVRDELEQADAVDNKSVTQFFAGRNVLEHYLN